MLAVCLQLVGTMLWVHAAEAAMHTQVVSYTIDGKAHEGFLAYEDGAVGKRPGIVIAHDWMGMSDFVKGRAREVAAMGYVAFAADIYGKGIVAHDHAEAAKLSSALGADRKLLRQRMQAALDILRGHALVDETRLGAMGYCFGGMAALELARSGAPLEGVVTLHGALATPTPQDAAHIRGHILVLTGADDPHVSKAERQAFEDEMRQAQIDWQMVIYGGTMHAFAVPTANTPQMGLLYSARAERRSWEALKDFFGEVLTPHR